VRVFESPQATIISTFVTVFLLTAQDMATLTADTPPLQEPVMDRLPDMPGLQKQKQDAEDKGQTQRVDVFSRLIQSME